MRISDEIKKNKIKSSSSFGGVVKRMGSSGISENDVYNIGSFSSAKDVANDGSLEDYTDAELSNLFKIALKALFMRIVLSGLILTCVLFIQAYLISVTEDNYDSSLPPLQDRIHEIFQTNKYLPFGRVNILISILVVVVFMRGVIFTPPFQSMVNVIRLLLILSVGYMVRGIFISITTVPSPTVGCIPGSYNSSYKVLAILACNFGLADSCTDNIISGHAFSTIICSLFWLDSESCVLVRIGILMYISIICFLIIVTRGHYSIDVFFGILHAVILYNIYGISLRMRIAKVYDWSESSKLDRKHLEFGSFWGILGHIIGWFEIVDLRLRLIRLAMVKQSRFHKDFMGIRSDNEYDSAFDIVDSRKMCRELDYTNVFLFSNLIQLILHKCKLYTKY